MHTVEPIQWTSAGVVMLDQLKLPSEVVHYTYTDYRHVAKAIKTMIIRGAPAIGVAAAMGIALGVQRSEAITLDDLRAEFPVICETLANTRPTAVDLFWAIARLKRRFEELAQAASRNGATNLKEIRAAMVQEALLVHEERRAGDRSIGKFGAALMPKSGRVMTQCNAGALATAGIGTALGVIRVAVENGNQIEVLVPETRPYPSRFAPHRLGTARGWHPSHADHRQHGGPLPQDRRRRCRSSWRRSHRRERRHRQQNRHLRYRGPSQRK